MTTPLDDLGLSTEPVQQGGQLENEYADAFSQYRAAQTPQTRSAMLKHLRPVIDEAMTSYGGTNASPTLRSRARLMTLQSLDSYDPAKGRLKTHVLSQLRGLQRSAAQEANIISVPEQVSLDRQSLLEAEKDLADQLGRQPNSHELADHTGLSLKRIAHVRQARGSVSSGSVLAGAGDGNDEFMPASQLPGQNEGDAWAEYVYHDLDANDKYILEHLFGMHGADVRSTSQIAKDLGLSVSMVSQRAKKIQADLDARYEADLGI